MNKQEFLLRLGEALSGRNAKDREERLNFYSEMIDDRMEEGLSEEEAVAACSVEEFNRPITAESSTVKQKRQWAGWQVVFLVLGAPIWGSLLIAGAAVVFSVYASVWAVIVSLWAVFGSLVACGAYCVVASPFFAFSGMGLQSAAVIAAGLVFAGLAIFLFFGCKAATKYTVEFTKRLPRLIKSGFVKKEEA